ncbi:MAG: hypothetical protein DRO23_09435 [Thermoprotei archaeon]|nr:MAG: hypothetical protein DRO23_09435 [Thermoprotei archaeon]
MEQMLLFVVVKLISYIFFLDTLLLQQNLALVRKPGAKVDQLVTLLLRHLALMSFLLVVILISSFTYLVVLLLH